MADDYMHLQDVVSSSQHVPLWFQAGYYLVVSNLFTCYLVWHTDPT